MAIGKDTAMILETVKNPLVFFALSLLVIEAILAIVVTNSNLSEIHIFYSVCIMAFMFFCIVGIVTFITIKYPDNLYADLSRDPVFVAQIATAVSNSTARDNNAPETPKKINSQ
jgi:hypothetical protein